MKENEQLEKDEETLARERLEKSPLRQFIHERVKDISLEEMFQQEETCLRSSVAAQNAEQNKKLVTQGKLS